MSRIGRSILCLAVCVSACVSAPSQVDAAGEISLSAELGFTPCTIGSGAAGLAAQCTTIDVPLDPTGADPGEISLSVARIRAHQPSSRQDAFTLLAGGPGQSAIETFPVIASAFRHIMRERDVILIDQRGTGNSQALTCPQPLDSLGLDFDPDQRLIREATRECLSLLEQDPRYFTTSAAVVDLERLRQRLGIDQWNLYGISYGTRVALHYLRRYPDQVRTLILDAVVPPSVPLGPEIAPLAQRALDLIFQRCADSPDCAAAFATIAADTQTLMAELRRSPRRISYENMSQGRIEQMVFTWQHLALTLRLLSYNSQTAALLPSMLHEAIHNDNFAPLARQALLQAESVGGSMATGMHNAVICSEDAPWMHATARPPKNTSSAPDYYMGDAVVDTVLSVCAEWPVGIVDADFREPVVSEVPTLILSGEVDPITPPAYGDTVAASLAQSRHLINPHQGHMQAPFGCMPSIMARFVATASVDKLDIDCLSRLRVMPFFVDANGPLP